MLLDICEAPLSIQCPRLQVCAEREGLEAVHVLPPQGHCPSPLSPRLQSSERLAAKIIKQEMQGAITAVSYHC